MTSSTEAAPPNLKYSPEDLWVRMENDLALVGLTDYAQAHLGQVIDVNLLEPGAYVGKSERFGVLEARKVAFDLLSPLSGEVVEVNHRLIEDPELVNRSPYPQGWLVTIKLRDTTELDDLLSAEEYEEKLHAPSLRSRFQAPPDRGY